MSRCEIGIIARALIPSLILSFSWHRFCGGGWPYLVRIAENPGSSRRSCQTCSRGRSPGLCPISQEARKVKAYWNSGQQPQPQETLNGSSLRRGQHSHPLYPSGNEYSEQVALENFSEKRAKRVRKAAGSRPTLPRTGSWSKRPERNYWGEAMKITVEMNFWACFQKLRLRFSAAPDNRVDESKDPYFKSLLDKQAKRAADLFQMRISPENLLAQSGGRFSVFNSRPKKERSSIEALLRASLAWFEQPQSIP